MQHVVGILRADRFQQPPTQSRPRPPALLHPNRRAHGLPHQVERAAFIPEYVTPPARSPASPPQADAPPSTPKYVPPPPRPPPPPLCIPAERDRPRPANRNDAFTRFSRARQRDHRVVRDHKPLHSQNALQNLALIV